MEYIVATEVGFDLASKDLQRRTLSDTVRPY